MKSSVLAERLRMRAASHALMLRVTDADDIR